MWYQYLRTAWRLALRKPMMSFLMTIGIGVGIAASLLLVKYISWQWNFDRFHEYRSEIVRVQHNHFRQGVTTSKSARTYAGVAVTAKEKLPEVKDYVRMGHWIANDVLFRYQENMFRGRNSFFVDSSFFRLFSFDLLQGDSAKALSEPNTLVLTERLAKMFFGEEDPIGKEVLFENMRTFVVTGVVEDPPVQSHIQFDILISMSTMTHWGFGGDGVFGDRHLKHPYVYTYLKVHPTADLGSLAERLTAEVAAQKPQSSDRDIFHLQRLEDIHLYSQLDHEMTETGQGNNIWIFMGVALLILLLGWANHFNLFFGATIDQLPALGIRKVIGARRSHLFRQLFVAASLPAMLGLLLGAVLAKLVAPIISSSFQIPLVGVSIFSLVPVDPAFKLLLVLVAGTLLGSLLPASIISYINLEAFIKGRSLVSPRGSMLRNILVTMQFAIIMALMASSIIIFQQTGFMENQDKGFEMDDVIAIRAPLGKDFEEHKRDFPIFRHEISALPYIKSMGISNQIPGNQLRLVDHLSHGPDDYSFSFFRNYGSAAYFDVFDIDFLVRDQSIDPSVSERNFTIINEMASELLGFESPQDAMHQMLQISDWKEVEIIGVVANHHQRSLHHPVMPIIFDLSKNGLMTDGYYTFRLQHGTDRNAAMASIKALYQQAFPFTVFDPINVERHFAAQYRSDEHFKNLNLAFTALGFFVSFLGLLGLMMIVVGKRIKEIGIRRILGARLSNIVGLLFNDFLQILLTSTLIAALSSFYLMSRWLDNFSHRIDISWWIFVVTAMCTGLLVFLVVGYMSLRSLSVNPAETLRE